MMTESDDQSALRDELQALNQAVDAAIAKRTAWMDANMEAFARYRVGDEVFDRSSGRRLGVISRLYRFHGTNRDGRIRDARYDRSMDIDYEIQVGPNSFDNTSRMGGPWRICNREELIRSRAADIARLQASSSPSGGGV